MLKEQTGDMDEIHITDYHNYKLVVACSVKNKNTNMFAAVYHL